MIIFFWIGGAVATGAFAHVRRNRNAFGWFLLALLISPLLAFAFCDILREIEPNTHEIPDFNDLPAAEQRRIMKNFPANFPARNHG
jgi:hypothetical protein